MSLNWDMPRVDRAQVELRSLVLRRVFLIDRRGRWPPELVLVRKFEGLEGYVRFPAIQISMLALLYVSFREALRS